MRVDRIRRVAAMVIIRIFRRRGVTVIVRDPRAVKGTGRVAEKATGPEGIGIVPVVKAIPVHGAKNATAVRTINAMSVAKKSSLAETNHD